MEGMQFSFVHGKTSSYSEDDFLVSVSLDRREMCGESFSTPHTTVTPYGDVENKQSNCIRLMPQLNALSIDCPDAQSLSEDVEQTNDHKEKGLKDRDVLRSDNHTSLDPKPCKIKHSASGLYVMLHEGKLQMHALQDRDFRFVFQKIEAGGTEASARSYLSEIESDKTVIVISLNDVIGQPDSIVCTAANDVGVKVLPKADKKLQVIPTDTDERYFYLRRTAGNNVCIMSAIQKEDMYCLASDGKKVFLKKIEDKRLLTKDKDIQFKIY